MKRNKKRSIEVKPGKAPYAARYGWVTINASFSVLYEAFNLQSGANAGLLYSPYGEVNSNRFVYNVISGSGILMPSSVVPAHGFTPGICGGSGLSTGSNCFPH